MIAPCVLSGPINRDAFEAYVEQILVPYLRPGDTVIMDKLSSHKGPRAKQMIEAAGASLRFLPPCSPDLNPSMDGSCVARAFVRFFELVVCGHVFGVFAQRSCCAP